MLNLYKFGERGSKTKGKSQDFYQLRDELLKSGKLFEDPEFPAADSSLKPTGKPDEAFQWKRPSEIVDNPQFSIAQFDRFDVVQGELGDCWLLAAVAAISLNRQLFRHIVPSDQGFGDNYAGIFHFRIWRFGRWIEVVIDDRLPTKEGRLVYTQSADEKEFCSALLEKAFAKVHKSYKAIVAGQTNEAMQDLTGGVVETYVLKEGPPNMFKVILRAYERASLIAASISAKDKERKTTESLLTGHAYSITRVRNVEIKTSKRSGTIPLIRLRNPWGGTEWKGAWSDDAPEWSTISADEKAELGLVFDNDGEFWMSFDDFQAYFTRVMICNLRPDSLSKDELAGDRNKVWVTSMFEGEWVKGVSAGGNKNNDTYCRNPQYRITLNEKDKDDDEGKCTLVVSLTQKNRRKDHNAQMLAIDFCIYHLRDPHGVPKPLDLNFFKQNVALSASNYTRNRDCTSRFKLEPGTYCIVPSTFDPNEEGEFLLRVFSEQENNMQENDQEVGFGEIDKKATDVKPTSVKTEEDAKTQEMFLQLAGDDGVIDWMELKQILDCCTKKGAKDQGISKETCRSMISMLDYDRMGQLNLEEFNILWNSIRIWKNVFNLYDADSSGTLNKFELRQAMNSAGYTVSNRILKILMQRYGTAEGEVYLDEFILCVIKMKTVLDFFHERDTKKTNSATFTLEEWLEHTICG